MKSPLKRQGAKARLREFFLQNTGKVLDSKILYEVSGKTSEWARRVRELRDEEGMQILSHKDLDELKPGQYILKDPTPRIVSTRNISKKLRSEVLVKDGYTCQMCGATPGELHPFDKRPVKLHIGHIIDKSMGGKDELSNLRAVCSVCNEGASNITSTSEDAIKLLAQLRKATRDDQLKVLEWLETKFTDRRH